MLPGCSTAFILITARLVPELLDPVNKERRGMGHKRQEDIVRLKQGEGKNCRKQTPAAL